MKKWVLILCSVFFANIVMAQIPVNEPPFKRFPTVPPIQLLLKDSSILTKDQLKKQPLLIMYFSPTCDHCQHQIEDIIKDMDKLSSTQIVLATYQPFEEIDEFVKTYQLNKYPNIRIGRDSKYLLPPFFNIRSLPYLALYNKKGDLLTTFEGNVKVPKLLQAFK